MNVENDAYLNAGASELRATIARLWPKRWWIVAMTLCGAAAFLIAALFMSPVYRASTILVPASNERGAMGSVSAALEQLGGLASLGGINLGSGSAQVEEALAVLRSGEFTERFIRDNNILPVLFSSRWDRDHGQWRTDAGRVPTLAAGAKLFQKRVRSVAYDKKTGLVTLSIEWTDPVLAASWANALITTLNEEMRLRAISSTTASVEYLQKELAATATVDTRQAIGRLLESQINQRMFANVTREYAFRVADRALAPEKDDPARPDKLVMVIVGLVTGFVVGLLIALALTSTLLPRTRPAALDRTS